MHAGDIINVRCAVDVLEGAGLLRGDLRGVDERQAREAGVEQLEDARRGGRRRRPGQRVDGGDGGGAEVAAGEEVRDGRRGGVGLLGGGAEGRGDGLRGERVVDLGLEEEGEGLGARGHG